MMIYRLTRDKSYNFLMLQYTTKGFGSVYSWTDTDGVYISLWGDCMTEIENSTMFLWIDFNHDGTINVGIPVTKVDVLTIEAV